jgi:hypothetical protein
LLKKKYTGCSKRPLSEAAANEDPRRTSFWYVEGPRDARTKLEAFFNVVTKAPALMWAIGPAY